MDVETIIPNETCPILWRGRAVEAPVGTVTLRTCAWCGESLGETQRCNGTLSHGICQSCFERETGHGGSE